MSDRRSEIVQFIGDFYDRHGFYPVVREISAGVGLSSTQSVHGHLCALVDQGRLRRMQVTTKSFVFALPEKP